MTVLVLALIFWVVVIPLGVVVAALVYPRLLRHRMEARGTVRRSASPVVPSGPPRVRLTTLPPGSSRP